MVETILHKPSNKSYSNGSHPMLTSEQHDWFQHFSVSKCGEIETRKLFRTFMCLRVLLRRIPLNRHHMNLLEKKDEDVIE